MDGFLTYTLVESCDTYKVHIQLLIRDHGQIYHMQVPDLIIVLVSFINWVELILHVVTVQTHAGYILFQVSAECNVCLSVVCDELSHSKLETFTHRYHIYMHSCA